MSKPEHPRVAIACQGGGSHTAFTAGVLKRVLAEDDLAFEIGGLSGTSGGAMSALMAWYGLLTDGREAGIRLLESFWDEVAARGPFDRAVNDWTVGYSRLRASGAAIPEASPYYLPFGNWGRERLRSVLESHVDFEAIPDLVGPDSPKLIVGTVNVNQGYFETFLDEEVTADAVLASAAVPDVFQAVEIHGHYHWDGLFSQNPPVNDFMSGRSEKPDEIWVVQINPQERDGEPRTLEEIADRRNELSGNISLNQELRFIAQVNEWIDDGQLPAEHFKRITIRKIELARQYHCSTKLDRNPAFVEKLIDLGEQKADEFLDALR